VQAPTQQNYDPFAGFGGVDPFAFQYQQQQQMQQQMQQQEMLRQQEMQRQQELMRQQELLRQQELIRQNQMQQQMINQQNQNMGLENAFGGNPFAKPAPPPLQFNNDGQNPNLSSNLSKIDPFAQVQAQPVAQPAYQAQAAGSNPFAAQNLVNLDANSLKKETVVPRNPFNPSNSQKFQWEPAKPAGPSLSQLSGSNGSQLSAQQSFGAGASPFGQPMNMNPQAQNPFGQQQQPFGQMPYQQTGATNTSFTSNHFQPTYKQ
jgi:epsin